MLGDPVRRWRVRGRRCRRSLCILVWCGGRAYGRSHRRTRRAGLSGRRVSNLNPHGSSPSPPLSTSPLPSGHIHSLAPYGPRFQSRGVYIAPVQTNAHKHKAKHDAARVEHTKLERRLENSSSFIFCYKPVRQNLINYNLSVGVLTFSIWIWQA